MRGRIMMVAVLAVSAVAYAKEPKAYETGKVQQLDLVACDPGAKLLCQEYVLQNEQVVYRLRPREKHPTMLSVGGYAQFRLAKEGMMVRPEGANPKEHPYVVVSVAPRTDSEAASTTAVHLNHLQ